MKIYVAKVCAIPERFLERLFAVMDRERVEKVRALRNEKERLRSIHAGLLLRHAFLEEGHDEDTWRQIKIARGIYGKPYLSNCEDFFYSLSHSGEWVICAVDDIETGADIQAVGEPKMAVAKRFYADEEYDRLLKEASDKDRQRAELYRMWTAKESCVKLTGRGIGAGISRYVTDSAYTHIIDMEENGRFFIKLYEQISGYIICACSRRDSFPQSIILTDIVNITFNMEEKQTC